LKFVEKSISFSNIQVTRKKNSILLENKCNSDIFSSFFGYDYILKELKFPSNLITKIIHIYYINAKKAITTIFYRLASSSHQQITQKYIKKYFFIPK
jgi:hypothetical protein